MGLKVKLVEGSYRLFGDASIVPVANRWLDTAPAVSGVKET